MNPVPLMKLVELAKGQHTSQQTFEACKGLAEFLGKDVATSQDRPVRVTTCYNICHVVKFQKVDCCGRCVRRARVWQRGSGKDMATSQDKPVCVTKCYNICYVMLLCYTWWAVLADLLGLQGAGRAPGQGRGNQPGQAGACYNTLQHMLCSKGLNVSADL
jgi:hypothetical protein